MFSFTYHTPVGQSHRAGRQNYGHAMFAKQACHTAKRNRITHIPIGDPTTGYGIFIENMLKNMPGNGAKKRATSNRNGLMLPFAIYFSGMIG